LWVEITRCLVAEGLGKGQAIRRTQKILYEFQTLVHWLRFSPLPTGQRVWVYAQPRGQGSRERAPSDAGGPLAFRFGKAPERLQIGFVAEKRQDEPP